MTHGVARAARQPPKVRQNVRLVNNGGETTTPSHTPTTITEVIDAEPDRMAP